MPFVSNASLRQLVSMLTAIQASLNILSRKTDKIMTALDNLQAADVALKAEVITFLSDIAAKLAAAGASDPAIQAVADDINEQVTSLQNADTPPSA